MTELDHGTSKGQVVADLIDTVMGLENLGSPEQARFANKVIVSNYTANTIEQLNDTHDLRLFFELISGVTADGASVDNAKILVDAY